VYAGIDLLVVDPQLRPSAESFFERTSEALATAADHAPTAFDELRRDLARVVLWDKGGATYNRFQLGALVPPIIALESDSTRYAAWLLYVSGLAHSRRRAWGRAQAILQSLDPDERNEVGRWLESVTAEPEQERR